MLSIQTEGLEFLGLAGMVRLFIAVVVSLAGVCGRKREMMLQLRFGRSETYREDPEYKEHLNNF
jgi:hypothetical protein